MGTRARGRRERLFRAEGAMNAKAGGVSELGLFKRGGKAGWRRAWRPVEGTGTFFLRDPGSCWRA